MTCGTLLIFSVSITAYLSAYILLIGTLNVTGNVLLIWAIKKTGQTKTISCQFIVMMSVSDVALSSMNIILLIATRFQEQEMSCWFRLFSLFFLNTCNGYSMLMVAFIALDRYLHMRYLARYPSIVTKKRGHFLAVTSFLLLSVINAIFVFLQSKNVLQVFQIVYLLASAPIVFTIFMLYYNAMKAIRKKASQLAMDVITRTKTLFKAAKIITICIIGLIMPMLAMQVLQLANNHYKFATSSLMDNLKLCAYTTFTSNAFCSSVVFMSLNRPIRLLLRRSIRRFFRCTTVAVRSTDTVD